MCWAGFSMDSQRGPAGNVGGPFPIVHKEMRVAFLVFAQQCARNKWIRLHPPQLSTEK